MGLTIIQSCGHWPHPVKRCAIHLNIYTYILKYVYSCEIKDFVEPHICKLCAILRSPVLLSLCPCYGYRSAPFLSTSLDQGQHSDVNQSVHGKHSTCVEVKQTSTAVECTCILYIPCSRMSWGTEGGIQQRGGMYSVCAWS